MYELNDEVNAMLDSNIATAIVELIRALMGAPPELSHLIAITDYLVLVHQASDTYITHLRHNMYFMLPPLKERKTSLTKPNDNMIIISSDDSSGVVVESDKLSKALTNEQVRRLRVFCYKVFLFSKLE